ncbi:MAG: UpxY family transcription antiterminator [Candidatus Acidiferrum sp.]
MNIVYQRTREQETRSLASEFNEPHWYAAYTWTNHEKKVTQQLSDRSVEHFLPLYESVRRWKDRCVKLELPLFPSYIFVRMALSERLKILQLPSIVRLVGFGGQPTVLADHEVQTLRASLALPAEPHPYLTVGHRVRVKVGALEGTEGVLIRKKNALRLVLSIDLIMKSASVEVDASDVETI